MTSQSILKERQRLSEISKLSIFDSDQKIDDSKRVVLDVYMIIKFSDTGSKISIILTSVDIVNLRDLKRAAIDQFEML